MVVGQDHTIEMIDSHAAERRGYQSLSRVEVRARQTTGRRAEVNGNMATRKPLSRVSFAGVIYTGTAVSQGTWFILTVPATTISTTQAAVNRSHSATGAANGVIVVPISPRGTASQAIKGMANRLDKRPAGSNKWKCYRVAGDVPRVAARVVSCPREKCCLLQRESRDYSLVVQMASR